MGIEGILFTNLEDGETRAEISGGGFNNGLPPVVTLDGSIFLDVVESSGRMIVATIPAGTPDGDYTLKVSTGTQPKKNDSPSWIYIQPNSLSVQGAFQIFTIFST